MIAESIPEARVRLGVLEEEYHRRELGVVTTGALKAARRTPYHYRARADQDDRTPTDAMVFGQVFHMAATQRELFDREVAVEWEYLKDWQHDPIWGDRQMARRRWELWNAGASYEVTAAEYQKIVGMLQALHAHPLVGRVLRAKGVAESTVEWTDPDSGLPCKCRPDWWAQDIGVMVDLKTTVDADLRRFSYSARDFGYDLQAVHYEAGTVAAGLPAKMIFVAIEKDPPHAIAVYQIDPDDLDAAREERREAMGRIALGMRTGDWPGYSPDIQTLTLPRRRT